ncbi:hypothetical protein ACLQ2Q_20520 [Microbacterium sp. DT81.1]|uniref:hypothetical protein n=1 Tax=Microbacterium sp. DT81.1 TaxID=3393413 RepID=UPI003CFA10DA
MSAKTRGRGLYEYLTPTRKALRENMAPAQPTPSQIAARVAPRAAAAAAPRSTPEGRRLSRKAATQIQELGVDVAAVDRAIGEPHSTERTHQHNGTLYIRGDLGVIVPDDDPALVIALLRIDPGAAPAPRGRRASGGPAHQMPESSAELERLLIAHGFEISAGRGGHHKATYRDHPGVTITIPHTPSDHRSYPNLLAEIRRRTGVDVRPAR